jgi:hypothetical protein
MHRDFPRRIGTPLSAVLLAAIDVAASDPVSAQEATSTGRPPVEAQVAFLGQGLATLPLLSTARTRSVSAENPTGGKGLGGRSVPDPTEKEYPLSGRAADELGQGWKVRPFLRVNRGQTAILMDVKGPGVIQHIWMVENISRAHVLRFYWDGEETPSIEVPAPDFFAVGHETVAPVNSLAVVVNPRNALNCYWPMPFRSRARVTLTNESSTRDLDLMAYQITYQEIEVPAGAGMLHAQFRRARTDAVNPYVILDGVRGHGRYVGTFLAWTQRKNGWFGEGEVKFFIDGDREFPTICGTGTEDYFGGRYGFPSPFSGPYSGTTLPANDNAEPPVRWSLYRWHIPDPINFQQDLKVAIQALGWNDRGKYQKLNDDIASVAYWYQAEPHAPFPKLPGLEERTTKLLPAPTHAASTEVPGR